MSHVEDPITIDVVAIGASAGGVEAYKELFSHLGPEFRPAVLVVQHFPEDSNSVLPQIIARARRGQAARAEDGEAIAAGKVYVGPPGRHMLVKQGRIKLVRGPKENANRPAIDPLFRSAAICYGDRLATVLLSGLLNDGTVGMAVAKREGSITIAQNPDDAAFGDMPANAIAKVEMHHVLALPEMAKLLHELAAPECHPEDCLMNKDITDPTEMTMDQLRELESLGRPSAFTCPECHGTLFDLEEAGVEYHRCRVGHAYTGDSLAAAQGETLEAALWAALRSLEENASLLASLSKRATAAGRTLSAQQFLKKKALSDQQATLIRRALEANSLGKEGNPYTDTND
jgi:two-component system, chemotaxis family, protein-glutamate methylesterase/glutaminase